MKQIHLFALLFISVTLTTTLADAKSRSKHHTTSTSSKSKADKTPSDPLKPTSKLSPTIYCTPDVTQYQCDQDEKKSIIDGHGLVLAAVCPQAKAKCDLEGACFAKNPQGQRILVNYEGAKRSRAYYKIVDTNTCPYGKGKDETCLDPYYTVAADACKSGCTFKIGDVIFVPKIKDLILPNGTKHTGYLIVRDIGKKIKGNHLDFFAGDNCDDQNPVANPFASLNLQNYTDKVPFARIKDPKEVARIQALRNYPNYPVQSAVAPVKPPSIWSIPYKDHRNYIGDGTGFGGQ